MDITLFLRISLSWKKDHLPDVCFSTVFDHLNHKNSGIRHLQFVGLARSQHLMNYDFTLLTYNPQPGICLQLALEFDSKSTLR